MLILHLGFPKCGSTSMQVFFRNFPGFLGCDVKGKVGSFYKDDLTEFFEGHCRFSPLRVFKKEADKACEKIDKLIDSNQTTIYSNENVCFRMIPSDLPPSLKIERHSKIFRKPDLILINHRRPSTFLFSQYRLFVTNGYTGSLNDFFLEAEMSNKLGYYEYIDLWELKKDLRDFFPSSKIMFINIEKQKSIEKAMYFANLHCSRHKLQRENIGISFNRIDKHLSFNKNRKGRKLFHDWVEIHRLFPSSKVDDSHKFHLSRMRHLHEDINLSTSSESDKKIQKYDQYIPSFLRYLDQSYFRFIKEHNEVNEGLILFK